MGWSATKDTVYVVSWDDAGIIKAGSSHVQRWRGFVIRGARIVSLTEYDDVSACYHAENEMHKHLRRIFPKAFTSRHEAIPYLGSGGGGWAECYLLGSNPRSIAPEHSPEHCPSAPDPHIHGRTDGTNGLTNDVVSPHQDIFPVRYAHASRRAL